MPQEFQEFGDGRTIKKLDIIEEYARLFVSVLSRLGWAKTHYIDAFAGEGYLFVKDTDKLVKGSVSRMGQLGFDQFHFVELDKRKCENLKAVISSLKIQNISNIYQGDANKALPIIVNNLTKQDRSLIFIDPFGMQFKWETLVKISKVPYCDIVYLFPCHTILRATPTQSDGVLHEDMKNSACSCLGMTEDEITEEFYSPKPPLAQQPLFEEMREGEKLVRLKGYPEVERLVWERLNSIFKYVYGPPYRLTLDDKPDLYTMYLMTSNDSEPAKKAIKRLGQHVFKSSNDQ